MHIWVDADAVPKVIKEVLIKASMRTGLALTFVANQPVATPSVPHIRSLQVEKGFDIADNEIVRRAEPNDLVITSDIPLAAEVLEKGAHALSPRGERFTANTIGARLNMRDFMDTMRASGVPQHGGPPPLNLQDRQEFANQLDRLLAKAVK
ncbi:YaiI/YqxD family protein [Gynuella sp.]|uniref:YaiI/YqxD family protein n=1 Tax=Gynuella sp. TaxID=2969146 RepID=UPI003D0EFAAD